MKKAISLNGLWNLYYSDKYDTSVKNPHEIEEIEKTKIKANVPCNVETALADAGIIGKDLYKGMATQENMKFEDYHWWFEREFEVDKIKKGEKICLNFGMVDCLAEYYINGKLVHTSDNAFCEIKIDITDAVFIGEKNIVLVHILPAMPYVLSQKYYQGMICDVFNYNSYIRKPAHCFGWDIMPRAVSAGLYRDVSLAVFDEYNFDELSYHVMEANEKSAFVRFYAIFDIPYVQHRGKVEVRISGKCEDSEFCIIRDFCHFKSGYIDLAIKKPKLWWPYGYGKANIYDIKAELIVDGEVKDVIYDTMGIRTVRLDRTESLLEENPRFQFYINDVPVMCKGSNWVPMDAYHSRDKDRYAKALELVSDCGCNILRIWGGGVYEQQEFYDYCDRNGIMIWHDFMMACYQPAMDDDFMLKLEKEFVWAVKKLRNHASIIVWAGDNEIDECGVGFGANTDSNRVTRALIPKVLSMHDRTRPYIPSSPYIPASLSKMYLNGKDVFVERHLWGSRDYYKADFYAQSKACFVSEEGYHGCPSVESLKKIVDSDKLWPIYNEQWSLHSSDQAGSTHRVKLMDEQITQMFGFKANNIDDFVCASQISQAEAKKFFIEHIRIGKPYTSGIIWWNLIDGWPQMSDAVVDYFYNKKLAYEYIKRSQQPFALMMGELKDWNYPLYAENDTLDTVCGDYSVLDIDTGETLAKGEFSVAPNSGEKIDDIALYYSDKKFLVIQWTVNGKNYFNHYLCGRPAFDFNKYKKWLERYKEISNVNGN